MNNISLVYATVNGVSQLIIVPKGYEDKLNDENIMPEAFDPQVAEVVANAVKAHIK